jgi:hemoglobin/transferrin/lactoferrin receptor protein
VKPNVGRAGVRKLLAATFLLAPWTVSPLPLAGSARAQEEARRDTVLDRRIEPDSLSVILLDGINITASREVREVFLTPAPTVVVGPGHIRRRPGEPLIDWFSELPGLDREGVGGNQGRPVIRGLRGQRVLLLKDGLRLNNARRRLDSGEPPALAGRADVQRVEVVRGPASVLYGSDAIGGVVNIITHEPFGGDERPWAGELVTAYGSGDDQTRMDGITSGQAGPLAMRASAGYGTRRSYRAPAGRFGDVIIERDVPVQGTGVTEVEGSLEVMLGVGENQQLLVGAESYHARDAAFGYLDPSLFGEGLPTVDISFPEHNFDRYTLRYRGTGLALSWMDRLDVALYTQSNERDFQTRVSSPLGPGAPPGSTVEVLTRNHTRLDARGVRIEATKLLGRVHTLTYGLELYEDRARGSDSSTVTIRGLGPPSVRSNGDSPVPDAQLRSLGVFVQDRLALSERTELLLGGRYQDVAARPLNPHEDGLAQEVSDHTLVGAANLLHHVTPELTAVASLSRGFRSPNLVERFFTGTTPEGSGVWIRNPTLEPETSVNMDLGLRWRFSAVTGEVFLFRNALTDGIRLEPTGDSIGAQPAYRNVNVGKLHLRGIETHVDLNLGRGFDASTGYTVLDCRNPGDAEDAVSESCGNRAIGGLRWTGSGVPAWVDYSVRWSSRRDLTGSDPGPVGPVIPSFVVHHLRTGVRLADRYVISLSIRNLGNTLYAETQNAGFFRPEPRRNVILGLSAFF